MQNAGSQRVRLRWPQASRISSVLLRYDISSGRSGHLPLEGGGLLKSGRSCPEGSDSETMRHGEERASTAPRKRLRANNPRLPPETRACRMAVARGVNGERRVEQCRLIRRFAPPFRSLNRRGCPSWANRSFRLISPPKELPPEVRPSSFSIA